MIENIKSLLILIQTPLNIKNKIILHQSYQTISYKQKQCICQGSMKTLNNSYRVRSIDTETNNIYYKRHCNWYTYIEKEKHLQSKICQLSFFCTLNICLQVQIFGLVWFGLVWFYGISIILGYLMPNPFLYINSSISNNSV